MAETIGQRLKQARDRSVYSLNELAMCSGVTKATIINIEKDRFTRTPNRETIRKLAAALGVNPSWLLTGDETPHRGADA